MVESTYFVYGPGKPQYGDPRRLRMAWYDCSDKEQWVVGFCCRKTCLDSWMVYNISLGLEKKQVFYKSVFFCLREFVSMKLLKSHCSFGGGQFGTANWAVPRWSVFTPESWTWLPWKDENAGWYPWGARIAIEAMKTRHVVYMCQWDKTSIQPWASLGKYQQSIIHQVHIKSI